MVRLTTRDDVTVPPISAKWCVGNVTWSYTFYYARGVLHLFKEDSSGRIEQVLLEHRDWLRSKRCYRDIHKVFLTNLPKCECPASRKGNTEKNVRYYWIKNLGLDERVLFNISATPKDSTMELTCVRKSHGERLRIKAKLRTWLPLFKNKAAVIDKLFASSQLWLSLPPTLI